MFLGGDKCSQSREVDYEQELAYWRKSSEGSVVMLDNDPLHVLLLNPGFLPLLQVAEAVSPTINVNVLQSSMKMVYIPDSSRTPVVHGRSLRVLELVLYARFLQDWTVG